ncbi:MAG: hypothetical protein ABI068_17890, partial [Ktedonobacterales bacterium]
MNTPEGDESRDGDAAQDDQFHQQYYAGDARYGNYGNYGNAPLPNRLDRETLGGCLGIVCILALLGSIWFVFDLGRLPIWISALLPTLAFALGAVGLLL